ncbi:DNA helicase-2 / ATP-dependent DNA helicase PcrA [Acetitomaculum ruminis DSM 5522]|uniref:DNA 3'-5' helicase n=1 Tax=Acetitomaculum ruminis DSM 5522 TaxID=1120918 RepID=A0A1I0VM72_9FIRM|nr:ATP-dependent helicase [Acetitomaculum ruminis]SFA77328.1 DNA helicase-2 / ATP-dependent DNA helicase PcrA [Acetitomaculum ruminis DSM 5522]
MELEYNESQLEALQHHDGPCLCIAGPGSGKTATISGRIKNLIEQFGVNPSNILVITFTKAAAVQMKNRFEKLIGESLPVSFGTFHAIYFKILKYAYHYTAANIASEEVKRQLVKEIVNQMSFDTDDINDFISDVCSKISTVKNEQLDISNYYPEGMTIEEFRFIYGNYQKALRSRALIDFDDIMVFCYDLLSQRPDILKAWQNKYQYILVDEFQDINRLQFEILRLIAKGRENIFVVGDDDQSIYKFRGAHPGIMKSFLKYYPSSKQVILKINYRSTKSIVDASKNLIKNNKNRFKKDITPFNEIYDPVVTLNFKNQIEEALFIIKTINKNVSQGKKYSDHAVIFRTNNQAIMLISKAIEFNMPFIMKDMVANIYDHWIAKDIYTYFNMAYGSRRREDFLRVVSKPNRYISRKALDTPVIEFDDLRKMLSDKEWMLERVDKMECDLNMLKGMPPYAAIDYIYRGIGYLDYLKEYAKFRNIKEDELIDTAIEIQESAKDYKTLEEWYSYIKEYSEKLKKQYSVKKDSNEDLTEFVTMHGAKGLEYDTVFIIDANEGITPYKKALTPADLEEERRMFYVAMTRAKRKLYISSIKERYNKELEVSRYLGELLFDRENLKEGQEIIHKTYGKCTVKKVKNGKIYLRSKEKDLVLDLDFVISKGLIKFT